MWVVLANFEYTDLNLGLKRLTPAQWERFESCKTEKRRLQFVWSRVVYNGLIRRICGKLPPTELTPGRPHPDFEYLGQRYYSSLSHTEHWVAVALDTHPVAVDIEQIKPRDWQKLSDFTFNAPQIQWIENSPSPLEAFYLIWGQRECTIKMQSWDSRSARLSAHKIHATPHALMLTCLSSPGHQWRPQILPTTLLENF